MSDYGYNTTLTVTTEKNIEPRMNNFDHLFTMYHHSIETSVIQATIDSSGDGGLIQVGICYYDGSETFKAENFFNVDVRYGGQRDLYLSNEDSY